MASMPTTTIIKTPTMLICQLVVWLVVDVSTLIIPRHANHLAVR